MRAAFEASNAFAATTADFAIRSTDVTASIVRFSEKVVSVIVPVTISVATSVAMCDFEARSRPVLEKLVAAELPLLRVSAAEIAASRRAAQPLTDVPDPLAHEASSLMVVMVASFRVVSRGASEEVG